MVAALSITSPTLRMTPARIRELEPTLIDEAWGLSRRLGHREAGEDAAGRRRGWDSPEFEALLSRASRPNEDAPR